jgi:RNA polymerase sigma factor (sigma-70 family)
VTTVPNYVSFEGGGASGSSLPATRDRDAWNSLVERYAPLVTSIVKRYRLGEADADDVAQTVWLRLVENIGEIREPSALARWIATITDRECMRVLRAGRQSRPFDPMAETDLVGQPDPVQPDEQFLRVERSQALLEALAELPDRQRSLLLLLAKEPPMTYAEISRSLGIPVGSIGPIRTRALRRLQQSASVAALLSEKEQTDESATSPNPSRAADRVDRAVVGADRKLLDALGAAHDVETGLAAVKAAAQAADPDIDRAVAAADRTLLDALGAAHNVEAGLAAVKATPNQAPPD